MTGVEYSRSYSGLAQYLIDGLQDPYNPTHCSGSVTAALQLISSETLDTTNPEERRRQTTLLKVLYRFVTVKRPIHQLRAWMDRFSTCANCKMSKDHRRPSKGATLTTFLHEFWQSVEPKFTAFHCWFCPAVGLLSKDTVYPTDSCYAVAYAMRLITTSLNCDFKAVAQGTNKRWPTTISHLIPYGPDQLVESVLQWYLIYPEPVIIQFFLALLNIVRSTVYPSLIKYQFIGVLVDTTKRILDVYLDIRDGVIQIDRAQQGTFLGTVQAMNPMLLCYLGLTIHHDHLLPHIKLALFSGYEIKTMQLLSILVSVNPGLIASMASHDIKDIEDPTRLRYSCIIYRDFNMHMPTSPASDMLVAASIVEHDHNTFFGNREGFEAEFGLSLIWQNGVMYGCSAKVYGCDRYFENVGRDLKFCEGCHGVYYCGKDCQIKDWNDEEYAHKRVCPALSKIVCVQRTYLEKTDVDFVPSNHVLKTAVRGNSDLEKVVAIRRIIRMGDLSPEEVSILRGWGRRIYRTHKMEEQEWQPGFPDYDVIVNCLMKPSKGHKAVYFAPMSKFPSEQVVKQKVQLLSTA